jgi:toxin ParE1/3/4
MQLEVSRRALDDLKRIARFIAKDKPLAAENFVDLIWSEFHVIRQHPLIFPEIAAVFPGLRKGRVGNYLILFRVQDDVVRIARVIHGMRDLPKFLR